METTTTLTADAESWLVPIPNLSGFGRLGAPGAAQHPLLHTGIRLQHRGQDSTHFICTVCVCNMPFFPHFFSFIEFLHASKIETIKVSFRSATRWCNTTHLCPLTFVHGRRIPSGIAPSGDGSEEVSAKQV